MGNKSIYSMSSAGSCIRKLSAERLDKEVSPDSTALMQAAEEGYWHEKRIKDELRSERYLVTEAGVCPVCKAERGIEREGIHVDIEIMAGIWLMGHLDGSVIPPESKECAGQHLVLEVKSMSQYQFDRVDALRL